MKQVDVFVRSTIAHGLFSRALCWVCVWSLSLLFQGGVLLWAGPVLQTVPSVSGPWADALGAEILEPRENLFWTVTDVPPGPAVTFFRLAYDEGPGPVEARFIKLISTGQLVIAFEVAPFQERRTLMLPGGVPLDLVRIPAGSFQMGAPETERGTWSGHESPVHEVTIGYDFFLGRHEVTQAHGWRSWARTRATSSRRTSSTGVVYRSSR